MLRRLYCTGRSVPIALGGLALAAVLAFSTPSAAENYTWTGDFFGVWNQALNWSPNVIPNSGGDGDWSWLHIDDAAKATAAAAEQGNPGIYLIANDQPLAVRQWLPAFAEWLSAPPPPHISLEDALKAGGAGAVYYGTQMRGASNAKAKRELNFQPRPLEWTVDAAVAQSG
jgi:2-alkyl-3-oxoalkanoate reductase